MDGVEHFRSRAPHAATEMNFGLRFAGSGRLARHGRPRQGSMYLRTAIMLNLHQPHGKERIPVYILNLHEPDGTRRIPVSIRLHEPV
jgi:hypothetical protein